MRIFLDYPLSGAVAGFLNYELTVLIVSGWVGRALCLPG